MGDSVDGVAELPFPPQAARAIAAVAITALGALRNAPHVSIDLRSAGVTMSALCANFLSPAIQAPATVFTVSNCHVLGAHSRAASDNTHHSRGIPGVSGCRHSVCICRHTVASMAAESSAKIRKKNASFFTMGYKHLPTADRSKMCCTNGGPRAYSP